MWRDLAPLAGNASRAGAATLRSSTWAAVASHLTPCSRSTFFTRLFDDSHPSSLRLWQRDENPELYVVAGAAERTVPSRRHYSPLYNTAAAKRRANMKTHCGGGVSGGWVVEELRGRGRQLSNSSAPPRPHCGNEHIR